METDIETIRLNIVSHVKHYMVVNNKSFGEVAKSLNISKSCAWHMCFHEQTNPKLTTLLKLAEALSVSLETLLTTKPMINLSTESVDFCVDNSKVNKKNKKGEK
jgi:DNA-binding phage protein